MVSLRTDFLSYVLSPIKMHASGPHLGVFLFKDFNKLHEIVRCSFQLPKGGSIGKACFTRTFSMDRGEYFVLKF